MIDYEKYTTGQEVDEVIELRNPTNAEIQATIICGYVFSRRITVGQNELLIFRRRKNVWVEQKNLDKTI